MVPPPDAFVYSANPARVVFGSGTLNRLPGEVERLGLRKVLVLSTPPQAGDGERLSAMLGSLSGGVFAGAVMHTPVSVTEEAMRVVAERGVDGLVAIGGGSTTGLGKAIALRTDLPQIVIPTSYAGSEMTPILGETAEGRKTTLNSAKVLPEVVIYDVDLTMSLPKGLSGTSGINAIAHAVEALYARDRNPIVDLMALEAIASLSQALPRISENPSDREARTMALYGAWLCGSCLGAVGMSIHHKLCHTLGGAFDLPHAETHSVVLPHALAYNAPAVAQVMNRLEEVLGKSAPLALFDLGRAVGVPLGLKDIGMPEDGIDKAVELALSNPYWNPRPLETEPIRRLLRRAWNGDPPDAA